MSVDKSLVESGDDIERAAAETDLSLINPPDRSRSTSIWMCTGGSRNL